MHQHPALVLTQIWCQPSFALVVRDSSSTPRSKVQARAGSAGDVKQKKRKSRTCNPYQPTMIGKCCLCCCVIFSIISLGLGISLLVSLNFLTSGKIMVPEYTVTDAVLNKFAMTPNKTLDYNLALTIKAENKYPINTLIQWEKFETVPIYENEELTTVDLAPFEIQKISKKELNPSYKGMKKLAKADEEASKMKSTKVFDIVLRITGRRKGKVAASKVDIKFTNECKLKVPTKSGGEKFESTKCVRKN